MNKLTEFGKVIRKLRIDYDTNLHQLATLIGVSPAFLSAVETGKKSGNIELIQRIKESLGLSCEEESSLIHAMSKSIDTVILKTKREDEAELALMFARRLNSDSLNIHKLRQLLEE